MPGWTPAPCCCAAPCRSARAAPRRTLHDALAALGAELLLRALRENPAPRPQPAVGASYAPKLTRADGVLEWHRHADALDLQVRALNPWPGTWCQWGSDTLKVLDAQSVPGQDVAGTVLDGPAIACGSGALRLLRVQRAGRAPMPADAFMRGSPIRVGMRLGA